MGSGAYGDDSNIGIGGGGRTLENGEQARGEDEMADVTVRRLNSGLYELEECHKYLTDTSVSTPYRVNSYGAVGLLEALLTLVISDGSRVISRL